MSFLCPNCNVESLKIDSSIELPSDSRSDEITLQIVKCSQCRFSGLAVYEESRRGSIDSESIEHRGYYLSKDKINVVKRLIEECPKPKDPYCQCTIHRTFGRVNESGRWNWLDDLKEKKTFLIL